MPQKERRRTVEPPRSVKGSPAASGGVPRRQWTELSAQEECRQLERQLTEARARRDTTEVRRLRARLRLLRPEQ